MALPWLRGAGGPRPICRPLQRSTPEPGPWLRGGRRGSEALSGERAGICRAKRGGQGPLPEMVPDPTPWSIWGIGDTAAHATREQPPPQTPGSGRWKQLALAEAKGHRSWGECPLPAASPGGRTVGITEETLHGVQVLAAQPGLVGLRGDGHQLRGGVFEEQVLLAVGLGAEHLEAAALLAEQALGGGGLLRPSPLPGPCQRPLLCPLGTRAGATPLPCPPGLPFVTQPPGPRRWLSPGPPDLPGLRSAAGTRGPHPCRPGPPPRGQARAPGGIASTR